MHKDLNAAPLNPLPVAVWLLALPIAAMELLSSAGATGLLSDPAAIGWRLEAVGRLGFRPAAMREMIATGYFPWRELLRLVSYPLVHASFTHALMAVVILLALGKMVGEVFRTWAMVLVFLGSALVGALAYAMVPGLSTPLIGAYPAVYGLIGAFTFLLWVNLAAKGANQYRAFSLIGLLLGIQLLFGLLFGGGYEWVADLAGFATGFVLSFVVSPGGWARVKAKLRRR
ncbi:MAG: Rhomboid family protein [Cereibacter sp.]|jgi:membrane associated rhomboid family serine protease|nr:Rhomboid family protein [Cereibacter sp.]